MVENYRDDRFVTSFPLAVIEQNRPRGGNVIHTHSFQELVIVASGSAVHMVSGREHPISAGDVFMISQGLEHGYKNFDQCCYYDVLYDSEMLHIEQADIREVAGYEFFFIKEPRLRMEQGIPPTLKLMPYQLKIATDYARRIIAEFSSAREGYAYSATALLMSLIVHISRCYQEDGCRNEMLLSAVDYIRSNLSEEISLNRLAEISRMSRTSFIRKFREFMNCSPIEYLLSCRIEQAKEMLVQDGNSVSEIAVACGFNDSNYFSRCFRKHTGCAPREYRKRELH